MSTELTPAWGALVVLEAALLLAGAILCWRLVIAPRTVWSPVLPPWNVRLGEFLGAAFGVVLAGLGAHAMVVQVARRAERLDALKDKIKAMLARAQTEDPA